MKFLSFFILFFALSSLNAATTSVNQNNETLITEHSAFDGKKKDRRHKRINKKRKKACNNWAKKSFAG